VRCVHVVRRATLSITGAIVWSATWGAIDETVTTDESHVQRWRGETSCNRMQIHPESITSKCIAATHQKPRPCVAVPLPADAQVYLSRVALSCTTRSLTSGVRLGDRLVHRRWRFDERWQDRCPDSPGDQGVDVLVECALSSAPRPASMRALRSAAR
jgi:hypothetical protein